MTRKRGAPRGPWQHRDTRPHQQKISALVWSQAEPTAGRIVVGLTYYAVLNAKLPSICEIGEKRNIVDLRARYPSDTRNVRGVTLSTKVGGGLRCLIVAEATYVT